MDVSYAKRMGHQKIEARIMKLPDGRHASEIVSITSETGEAVLWSEVFGFDASVTEITGRTVNRFDHFAQTAR